MADPKTVPEMLHGAADLYTERNKLYGDNYKRFGPIMKLLFPDGAHLLTDADFNRFGVFVQVIAKITRYAKNFERGGHSDSLDDVTVYSQMLQELDDELRRSIGERKATDDEDVDRCIPRREPASEQDEKIMHEREESDESVPKSFGKESVE